MTAAHAFEYEVGPHSPAPVEAVEQAEGGNVVYLTRDGNRVAALVPAHQADLYELVIQAALDGVTDMARVDPQRARTTIVDLLDKAGHPSSTVQQHFREQLEDLLDDLDNSSTAVARLERYRAGVGSTESHDEVTRRHW